MMCLMADQIGMLKIDCYAYVRHYFMMSVTAHFHSFEKVFSLDHEKFTQKIIVGDTEINDVLSRVDKEFPQR